MSRKFQILILAGVALLGYSGRYMIELSDRAAAYQLIKNLDRLAELEAEILGEKEGKAKSSTAVEDLIAIIKQVMVSSGTDPMISIYYSISVSK